MAESINLSSSAASAAKDDLGLPMSERPTCILCLGMAGSGKTTFVQVSFIIWFIIVDKKIFCVRSIVYSCTLIQRINAHLHSKKTPPYVVNLDPAVLQVPFPANIGM